MRVSTIGSGLIALCFAGCSQSDNTASDSQMSLTRDVQVPYYQSINVDGLACTEQAGKLTIRSGAVDLRGLAVRLDFRNGLKGNHTSTATTIVDLGRVKLATDGSNVIDVGGSGSSTVYAWFQLVDHDENPISDEVFLGRCGEATGSVPLRTAMAARASVNMLTKNCGKSGGPVVKVSGMLEVSEMKLRLVFRNSDDVSKASRATWVSPASITLVNEGQTIELYKQPSAAGVGGNPFIYATFVDGNGRAISEEMLLGRCNGEPPEASASRN